MNTDISAMNSVMEARLSMGPGHWRQSSEYSLRGQRDRFWQHL